MYSHTTNDSSALEIQSAHTYNILAEIHTVVVQECFTQMQEAQLLISCGMTPIRKLLVLVVNPFICHEAF